jgi:hypothetical protein
MTIDQPTDAAALARIRALQSRRPGYAVAQKCLEVQGRAEAADPSLRTSRGVRLHPDAWSWYVGALGEIEVGARLDALGPEWLVRHAVPVGSGTKDIDHLVIGPAGVFSINTKRHLGKAVWVGDHVLRVDNQNKRHLDRARSDAAEASRRLASRVGFPVAASSVLAIVGARSFRDARVGARSAPYVLDAAGLVQWLLAAPAVLTTAQLGLLRLAAEEPDTWHVDSASADTLRIMQRFDRLRAAVGDNPPAPGSVVAAERPVGQGNAGKRYARKPNAGSSSSMSKGSYGSNRGGRAASARASRAVRVPQASKSRPSRPKAQRGKRRGRVLTQLVRGALILALTYFASTHMPEIAEFIMALVVNTAPVPSPTPAP